MLARHANPVAQWGRGTIIALLFGFTSLPGLIAMATLGSETQRSTPSPAPAGDPVSPPDSPQSGMNQPGTNRSSPVNSTRVDPRCAVTPLASGTWRLRGPRTVTGRGTDTEVTLSQSDERWFIALRHFRFAGVNAPDRAPTIRSEGPFELQEDRGVISYRDDTRWRRLSFRIEPERLIMPAFVERKPGQWVYESWHGSFRLELPQSHREVPVGKASFPSTVNRNGYYTYEEAPYTPGTPEGRHLRLLTREKDGRLVERQRLIFDDYGWPRHERLLTTGQRSSSLAIGIYVAAPK